VAEPVSIHVDTQGTGVLPDDQLVEIIRDVFDLRPRAIIAHLQLLKPHYCATAAYGHFGRSEFSWEALDHVEQLKEKAGQVA
jgi:S-adenosylmethionine synthetase